MSKQPGSSSGDASRQAAARFAQMRQPQYSGGQTRPQPATSSGDASRQAAARFAQPQYYSGGQTSQPAASDASRQAAAPYAQQMRQQQYSGGQTRQPATATSDAAATQEAARTLFRQKHAELKAEAAGVATDFGAHISTIVFDPTQSRAAYDQFRAGPAAAKAAPSAAQVGEGTAVMLELLKKDISTMGLEEVKEHEAQLLALRELVARKLQEKTANQGGPPAGAGQGSSS